MNHICLMELECMLQEMSSVVGTFHHITSKERWLTRYSQQLVIEDEYIVITECYSFLLHTMSVLKKLHAKIWQEGYTVALSSGIIVLERSP